MMHGESVRLIIWPLYQSKHDKTATNPLGLSITSSWAWMPYAATTNEGISYHAGGSYETSETVQLPSFSSWPHRTVRTK